jgi:hypothetical protein
MINKLCGIKEGKNKINPAKAGFLIRLFDAFLNQRFW